MRRLSLMILSLCMLLLSGCATIDSDVKIDNDGSGTWNATIQSQAEPLEKEVITELIKEYPMPTYTIKAINNDGKTITVEDNDTTPYKSWLIASEFKNIDEFTLIRNAMVLKSKNENLAPALEKTTTGDYIVDLGQSGTLKNDNTILFTLGEHIRFVFKPSHGWLFYIGIGVAIVAVIGGGYIFYLRRKYYGDAA